MYQQNYSVPKQGFFPELAFFFVDGQNKFKPRPPIPPRTSKQSCCRTPPFYNNNQAFRQQFGQNCPLSNTNTTLGQNRPHFNTV